MGEARHDGDVAAVDRPFTKILDRRVGTRTPVEPDGHDNVVVVGSIDDDPNLSAERDERRAAEVPVVVRIADPVAAVRSDKEGVVPLAGVAGIE